MPRSGKGGRATPTNKQQSTMHSLSETPATTLTRLSQSQLNLLETCPRKFQHIYFDQLGSPITPEQQEKQNWGSRFHLVMQQRELGLPVESLIQEDAQLQSCVSALFNAAPEIFTSTPGIFREAEHCRTLNFQGYLLTVIYDLLIEESQSSQILDWKTYPKPKNRKHLEHDWQTRLYLYVLAETSDYLPEQISMTYWFVQSQPQPQSLKFNYNSAQHEQTRRDLSRLLNQLTGWLRRYQQTGENFPQVAEGSRYCGNCNFAVRCDRDREAAAEAVNLDWLSTLDNIQEVSL